MFIYDIELSTIIEPDVSKRKIGLDYAHSFTDYKSMGIACIGVWDYRSDSSRVFGEDTLADFQKFADSHDVAVGFNNIRFDNNVLKAGGVDIPASKSYDILSEIYRVLGSYQKGCRLDDVVKANFPNTGKTGNGADAPELWQKVNYTRVIDYCLNDVRLTKMILDKILRCGHIKNPIRPGEILEMRRP